MTFDLISRSNIKWLVTHSILVLEIRNVLGTYRKHNIPDLLVTLNLTFDLISRSNIMKWIVTHSILVLEMRNVLGRYKKYVIPDLLVTSNFTFDLSRSDIIKWFVTHLIAVVGWEFCFIDIWENDLFVYLEFYL